MNSDFTIFLDPIDGTKLQMQADCLCSASGNRYQVIDGIPRFVQPDNYALDFGRQWNEFKKIQLDSFTGIQISRDRLARCLNGHLEKIGATLVLEAGSGAGRFTEILLEKGAIVHSFDYSAAVIANAANNGHSALLTLFQADVRSMPLKKESYDYVIALGMIQHTPQPEETIVKLWAMVRPGGYLIFDHYIFSWKKLFPPPIGGAQEIYRYLILRLPSQRRASVVKKLVNFFFPIHWRARNSPVLRRILSRISPVCFYYNEHELKDKEIVYQWALLDTHDGTTDVFRHLRSMKEIVKILRALEAIEIEVRESGNGIEAFCRKPLL
jgi:2-polyprenyl-3-methyl-5-hydroxy-6-metoxy-1,4-benzoquinol methylase